jgi:membrane protein YdbS with pleckstrin-like domain
VWLTVAFVFLGLPFLAAYAVTASPWILAAAIAAVALYGAGLVLWLVVLPPIRYARWRYELSHDFLDIAKGIVWRKRYIIPFIRVQNTDTRQGPILRAFGLSSVTVSTAAGEHEIPGLDNEVAGQLRDKAAELARIAQEDV